MRSSRWTASLLGLLAACAGPGGGVGGARRLSQTNGIPAASSSASSTGATFVSGARIAVPHLGAAGEWQMAAGDYASSRYSTLDQITPQNAHGLHAAWTFSTGVLRGHEGQPLVVGTTMYVVTPYP